MLIRALNTISSHFTISCPHTRDGCNSIHTHEILDPAYEFMGEAMNKTGRPILYSCSWPDYIRTNKSLAHGVDYDTTAKHCA